MTDQVEQIRNNTSSNNVVNDENFKTIFESVNEDINNKGYSQLDGYTFSNDKHHNNQFSSIIIRKRMISSFCFP